MYNGGECSAFRGDCSIRSAHKEQNFQDVDMVATESEPQEPELSITKSKREIGELPFLVADLIPQTEGVTLLQPYQQWDARSYGFVN